MCSCMAAWIWEDGCVDTLLAQTTIHHTVPNLQLKLLEHTVYEIPVLRCLACQIAHSLVAPE